MYYYILSDLALKEDVGWNSALVDALGQSQGWRRPGMGVVYDGRSLLYSTEQLAFPVSSSEQRGSFDMKHPTHGRLCSVSVSYSITLEAPRNSGSAIHFYFVVTVLRVCIYMLLLVCVVCSGALEQCHTSSGHKLAVLCAVAMCRPCGQLDLVGYQSLQVSHYTITIIIVLYVRMHM